VTEVVAVEPEPYLRERASAAGAEAAVRVTVVDGLAEALPFGDGSFDAAVACLMLCSVPDQAAALTELHRVVRPGGELRFYEHVRASSRRGQQVQELVDRTFWPHLFGGCHTARDTVAAIEAAGFAIERHRDMQLDSIPSILPIATHAIGVARRR